MKNILTLFAFIIAMTIISCKKETTDNKHLLVGKWNWKSSLEDNGTQMLPRDSSITDSFFVSFTYDNFINTAGCVIGGPSEGYYDLSTVSNKQILILKSSNTRPDTFYVNITNNQLDLTEVYSNYSWTHTFTKRNK